MGCFSVGSSLSHQIQGIWDPENAKCLAIRALLLSRDTKVSPDFPEKACYQLVSIDASEVVTGVSHLLKATDIEGN